jgi:hypothetical protein
MFSSGWQVGETWGSFEFYTRVGAVHGTYNDEAPGYPWEGLMGGSPSGRNQLFFHEDNQAMIQIVRTGRNPTMRHLGRVHKIAVAWLHEQWVAGVFIIFYEKTDLMAADIYTKSFTDKAKWQAVCWLINVVDPKMLSTMIRYNADTKKKLEDEDVAKAAAKKAWKAKLRLPARLLWLWSRRAPGI